MIDGLLNGRVGNLMDESLSCMARWLKMIMKEVVALVEKGMNCLKKSAVFNLNIVVDGKMLLEVFISAGTSLKNCPSLVTSHPLISRQQ
jgi:hypothetical protein